MGKVQVFMLERGCPTLQNNCKMKKCAIIRSIKLALNYTVLTKLHVHRSKLMFIYKGR